MNTATSTSVKISRLFKASPRRVWDAWSTAEGLSQWACPEGATMVDTSVDLRVGGRYCIKMGGAEGESYTAVGEYREIDPAKRLVYTWEWEEPEQAMGDTIVTVEFRDLGGSTEIVLTHEGFPTDDAAAGHAEGWGLCLDQLAELLARVALATPPAGPI